MLIDPGTVGWVLSPKMGSPVPNVDHQEHYRNQDNDQFGNTNIPRTNNNSCQHERQSKDVKAHCEHDYFKRFSIIPTASDKKIEAVNAARQSVKPTI
jgi:hypothetical protein